MPNFSYTALDPNGKTVKGTLDLGSRSEVYRNLESQRLTPIQVKPPNEDSNLEKRASARRGKVKLRRSALILFTEELADLLDAGLQLQQALNVMHERQQHPGVRAISGELRELLREGETFSGALRSTSPSFDELYCNLVAAGEVSGSLPQILKRLAANLTIIHELQIRVVQAMVYPAFMIFACIGLIVVFMTVLVPQLTELLSSTNQQLPAATRFLISMSDGFAVYWWKILIGLVVAAILFQISLATKGGRMWWDRIKLKIPLFGPVIATRFYAGFSQALGNLVLNGVPLLAALKLMVQASGNQYLKEKLKKVVSMVGAGDSFSGSLRNAGGFPPLFVDVVAIGEQTGYIGRSLEKAAGRYDKELDNRINRLTSLITPVIIIFMAGIVTLVAYSIVTAIFKSVSGIRGA